MRKVLKGSICSFLCLLNISMANAKEKETILEEIVVTATRTEKEVEAVPGSVSVIKKEDIEKRNIKAIDEAVNTIAGVFNKRGKGLMDTLADITLRGIPSAERTLVLMDGIILNDSYVGRVRYGGMAVEDVERIEVVKGPFSSLYGGYAMGGVVNIITKMPEKREFTLKTGYGSSWERGKAMDDLRKFYLSYGDKVKDKLSFFLSYGTKTTNGYPTDFNVTDKPPPQNITGWSFTTDNQGNLRYLIGDRGDNKWWDNNITLKVKYDLSQTSKINFSFRRNKYEYDYENPRTYLSNATTGAEVWSYGSVRESSFLSGGGGLTQNIFNAGYETLVRDIKIKISLGLLEVDKHWYITPGLTATRFGGPGRISENFAKTQSGEIQLTFPFLERHIITFGGFIKYGEANQKDIDLINWRDEKSKTTLYSQTKGKERIFALFLQDEIMIFENLTLYLGIRYDWWKTSDGYAHQVGTPNYPKEYPSRTSSAVSPKAAIVYKPFDKTSLRASVGKAFRPPTLYELYRTWTFRGVTYAGNPNLKPETTTSWDISIEQGLGEGAKIKAVYFENHLRDLIYRKVVSETLQERINAAKALSKGVELEFEQKLRKGLKLFANFTYTNAKIKKNVAKPETEGKRLIQVPEKMFNIGGEFEKGSFSASLTGRYVSKRYSRDDNKDKVNGVYTSYDPYFVVDGKVSYKVTKNAIVSFSIDNIFNRKYFDYYKAPERSWFTEITIKF